MHTQRPSAQESIENRTFDEIQVGDSAYLEKRLTLDDIKLFAIMSGDINPAHLDDDFAKSTRFQEVVAHGMWGGALISTVLGTELPGPGTLYLGQTLRFRKPVRLGDTLRVSVRAKRKEAEHARITFECLCTNQNGETVIEGEAEVQAPTEKVRRPRAVLPRLRLAERGHLHEMLTAAEHPAPVSMAVVHPVDEVSILGAFESARQGLIRPVLVGPEAKVRAAADVAGVDISDFELIDVPHSHAAAAEAVALTRAGRVEALMKGRCTPTSCCTRWSSATLVCAPSAALAT